MTEKILVSVIIPTLNRAHLISRALESVRASDYPSVELLVVDQESDDQTLSVLDNLDVPWISDPIRGAGHARKEGLRNTNGDLVLFLDSDDWLAPSGITQLVGALGDTGSDLAYGLIGSVEIASNDRGAPPSAILAPLTSSSLVRRHAFGTFGELDDGNYSWPRWVARSRQDGLQCAEVAQLVAFRGLHEHNVSKQAGATQELFSMVRAHRDQAESI